MTIHSDVLTAADLYNTAAQVPGIRLEETQRMRRPRLRQRGWNIVTAGYTKRWKNGGNYGAARIHSASWDDHGLWFARLYEIDPNARIACYNSAADFRTKTNGKFN